MIRVGLRGEMVVAFALVTLFAIGLNTLVVLQLDSLVARGEELQVSAELARVAARGLQRVDVTSLSAILADVPDATGVAVLTPEGATRAQSGATVAVEPETARAVAGFGRPDVRALGYVAEGGLLVRAVVPLPGPERGSLALWRRAGSGGATGKRARGLTMLYVALDALVAGSFGWYLIARVVVQPVRRLADATRRVASGERDVRVPATATNELGDLARDFNHMTAALSEKEQQLAKQVAELRHANDSLRAAREEVVQSEKLASVGRLASGVAHELGNPVGAVTGYVSAMLRGRAADTGDDAEMLRRIEREMKRIDRIIRDLLDYARPRAEAREPVDLDALADAALAIVSVQKSFKSVTVERRRGEAGKVVGDAHRLQQVLVNLLINAADAMETTPEKRIVVSTFRTAFPAAPAARRKDDVPPPSGPAIGISVRDSGTGIEPKHLPTLFDPFFTTKEPGRGTGLGLAISRTIVEAMGGRVLVESEPGKGATFSVLLPPAAE